MSKIPIVTLTTDFGLQDYYVAALKGALLRYEPSLNIIDVAHNIKQHDIVEAAFAFKNAYAYFPEGTIHIVSVNNYAATATSMLVTSHEGHYFIMPDNGLLSLVFDELPAEMYRVPLAEGSHPTKPTFGKIVAHIAHQLPLADIGELTNYIIQRISIQPVISSTQIKGTIIHIDNYGNAIINITQSLFERVQQGRGFALYFKRFDPITRLSRYYYEVPVGEILCLFNAARYLEIAINMGDAAGLLGLHVDDAVQIDFH